MHNFWCQIFLKCFCETYTCFEKSQLQNFLIDNEHFNSIFVIKTKLHIYKFANLYQTMAMFVTDDLPEEDCTLPRAWMKFNVELNGQCTLRGTGLEGKPIATWLRARHKSPNNDWLWTHH